MSSWPGPISAITLFVEDLDAARTFYRDVWKPTQEASGLDIRPHECRHSYVTHLRAAGINDADLAEIATCRNAVVFERIDEQKITRRYDESCDQDHSTEHGQLRIAHVELL